MRSWESIILCRSGLFGRLGGELGGVEELIFCMDPGGEEFGVITWERATGEVLRASGETGVCFRLRWSDFIPENLFFILSVKESVLRGEDGSLGEGVPLDECPGLSICPLLLRLSLRRRSKKDGRFFIRPLPLDR